MLKPTNPRLSAPKTFNSTTVDAFLEYAEQEILSLGGALQYPVDLGVLRMLISSADKAEIIRRAAEDGWLISYDLRSIEPIVKG